MWIESHQSLRNHPKVKKAARLAGINEFEMIGRLHCLWWWALDYAPDGNLSKYSDDDIEDAVNWQGDKGKFIKALISCGFDNHCGLIEVKGKTKVIHDWYEYAGKLVERRAEDAERKRRERRKMSIGHPEDSDETARVPNQPNPTNLTQPTGDNQPIDPASPPSVELTPLQKSVLDSFGAKRFKNHVQRDAINSWNVYPNADVESAIKWAATKGFTLGQAIDNITRALPHWGKPKSNGQGSHAGNGFEAIRIARERREAAASGNI